MTLKAAVDQLWERAHQLRDDVQALRLVAVEDAPTAGRVKLVDEVGDAAEAVCGWTEAIVAEAARASDASQYPVRPDQVRQALDDCEAAIERAVAGFLDGLARTGRIDELTTLTNGGGRESRAWVASVKQTIDRVHPSLWGAGSALTAAWRELAERVPDGPAPAGTERRS
jgi:hypothetical protein